MKFKSAAGSIVTVTGKHQGIFTIDFDWFEEGACCDSYPDFNNDFVCPAITARCECCEPMRIDLEREGPMNYFWNGRHWESAEIYFTILQRALWVELSNYGGETWQYS